MRHRVDRKRHGGYALTTLLIFVAVGITITTATVALSISNTLSTTRQQQGILALQAAESGAENAMLRLLRNPSFTNETLSINGGIVTITSNGATLKTVISRAQMGSFTRIIQVDVDYTNNLLRIVSWREVFE